MSSLEEIIARSASEQELVVSYHDALELISIFERDRVRILGWEGWIKHSDDRLGHSHKHQGMVDLLSMKQAEAAEMTRNTIMQAYSEWQKEPKEENASLLFCITIA